MQTTKKAKGVRFFLHHRELVVDLFAGGGGASTGIEEAIGRPVDIAINHAEDAVSLHKVNHPQTAHFCSDVFEIDPISVTHGRSVGLLWASPDCKHFSKAKGGKPVSNKIRSLAWVVVKWAEQVQPRIICLENVEEFQTWGPLGKDGKPCKKRKGQTFQRWVSALRGLGYNVEWKELRASDYGTPTIRKRFFLVARRDGQPIVWPQPTHGDPKRKETKAKGLKPWRTAAECIDWTLPCPSIFDRKKPLADNTLRRIAKGIVKYVIEAQEPFIVKFRFNSDGSSIAEPMPTITAGSFIKRPGGSGHALGVCVPIVSSYYGHKTEVGESRATSADEPLKTQTTENRHALLMPSLVPFVASLAHSDESPNGVKRWGSGIRHLEEPMQTVLASGNGAALCVPTLIQCGYGERAGQSPRVPGLDKPLGTAVAGASKHAIVTAFITEHANASSQRNMSIDDPLRTQCAQVKGGHFAMVSPFLAKHYGGVVGSEINRPVGAVTTVDHHSLVTAHIQRDMGNSIGHEVRDPLGTVTAGGGGKSALVTSHIVKLRGDNTGHATDEPLHTITAGGTHAGEVRALLVKHHESWQEIEEGPVLVNIDGEQYAIVDIGMRMLQPHELFKAQGFPSTYRIDKGIDGKPLTKTAQVRMCGNSVPPELSCAIVGANYGVAQSLKVA